MQVVLCKASDLPEGAMKRFELMGYDVLAIHASGQYFALDAACTNKYADLSQGTLDLDRKVLVCQECRGSWDIATGEPKDSPAAFPLTVYEIVLTGEDLVLTFTY